MTPHGEIWRTVRWLGTLAIILLGAYFLVVSPMEKMLRQTSTSIENTMKAALSAVTGRDTRIVEGRAEITKTAEISELALLEMRMSATRSIEKSENFALLPLGTKRLIVRGHYRVKAGYRLKDGISLRMQNGKPVARFPKPEILSVELLDYQVLSEDDGWLNKIQAPDRAQILRELRQQMHDEAIASGMLGAVEATLSTRLRDLLDARAVEVEQTLP